MAMSSTSTTNPKLWVPGDWNAFFGFGTNILVNMLVLTGLLRFVLKMPDELVFGRILPATGLMLLLSTLYYAWLAYKLDIDLAEKLRRKGINVTRWRVLAVLAMSEGVTINELVQRSMTKQSA